MSYETAHWRMFNRFTRVLGLVALVVGGWFVWGGITVWWDGSYQTVRADAPSRADAIGLFVAGLAALALGVALVRIRAYRPDLGDHASSRLAEDEESNERRWWTGDRRSGIRTR